MTDDAAGVLAAVERLVHSWCDTHNLEALRYILNGFPLTSPLTDGWGLLEESLENVRAFGAARLSLEEKREVNRLIVVIQRMLDGR